MVLSMKQGKGIKRLGSLLEHKYEFELCPAQDGALHSSWPLPFCSHSVREHCRVTETHTQEGECNGIALLWSRIKARI